MCISTHSLTRRLTKNKIIFRWHPVISTHSLTRRLTWPFWGWGKADVFQLTASQGGWQKVTTFCRVSLIISTHSLTRRLTFRQPGRFVSRRNFNSQPHKEADSVPQLIFDKADISTHSLTRRLTGLYTAVNIPIKISTHSLTRRLTL